MNLLGRTVGIGWERQSQAAIVRLVVAVALTLAALLSAPTQRVVAGMIFAGAGSSSSLGADASSHRIANGKIAFLGGFPNGSLDVINPDGSGLRRLARCGTRRCEISDAVWSPNGRRIAFLRGVPTNGGYISLHVKNADGSGERRLASCGRFPGCSSLSWSPNGASLAIARNRALYVVDLSTGRMRLLSAAVAACTHHCPGCWSDCAPVDLAPSWSPDGSRIAFARTLGPCFGACPFLPYVVNADGRGLKRLSPFSGTLDCGGPFWSPDGRTVAFCASRTRSLNEGIYATNPDGSLLRLLVPALANGNQQLAVAGWSSDGRHILYIRTGYTRTGPQATALWIMNANGTGRRPLYRTGHATYRNATWSPDGQRIALVVEVDRGGKVNASRSGLFVIGADGRHLLRLAAAGGEPAWQPIP